MILSYHHNIFAYQGYKFVHTDKIRSISVGLAPFEKFLRILALQMKTLNLLEIPF